MAAEIFGEEVDRRINSTPSGIFYAESGQVLRILLGTDSTSASIHEELLAPDQDELKRVRIHRVLLLNGNVDLEDHLSKMRAHLGMTRDLLAEPEAVYQAPGLPLYLHLGSVGQSPIYYSYIKGEHGPQTLSFGLGYPEILDQEKLVRIAQSPLAVTTYPTSLSA